ncbi:MAG TPA: ATP-binding protein [Lapillicoccus sp.]|nr:ATP-binding protein [Lapillicoccus sp.]
MTELVHPRDLRGIPLFDPLTDAQLERLAAEGSMRSFAAGEELFHEGELAVAWWVLVEGTISLHRHVGTVDTVMGELVTPGQWSGGFTAWDDAGSYLATGVGATDGRVYVLGADRLRVLAAEWFGFGVHFIRGYVGTVRKVEATVREREALVALGTLAAGLAHELNNPASAAVRAVDSLDSTAASMYAALGRLAAGEMSSDQFARLDALRQELAAGSGPEDSLAEAELEETLGEWLADHAVPEEWLLAPPLAAAGADLAWCERVAAVLPEELLAPGVEWVASSLAVHALLDEVRESTRRVSDLVQRVRSYTQLDRASVQSTDIPEGLDSTVVMLAHQLGDGVVVERDYAPDVPRIEAMAAELNQVWTNLIDNAVDAMDGHGTIRLRTRLDSPDWVVVEVEDTGPGMSEETAKRLFDPFFTTKPVGQGTGLGLDISRRIVVDHHHGEITVDSAPGRTVFRVRLPVR